MGHRFLVSRLSALGDVVCTLPVASCLKAGFPGCEIVWAVDPRFAGVVECCKLVDRIVQVSPRLSPASWPKIEGEFQAALDMQGLFKSGIVIGRSRAQFKLGYHWQREGAWLFSQRVLPDPSSYHVVDQYVDVARAAGGKAARAVFELAAKKEDRVRVQANLKAKGAGESLVVMNPGAGWATKRWPAGHFSRLIDELQASGVQAVLIGGKAATDRQAVDEVLAGCKTQPIDMAGQTSVRELIALIDLAAAHVGGDTGSTHIAAALGKPAIGLYSITRPERSCPYGQIARCHYDPQSLSNIQPEKVFATLQEALA